MEIEFSSIDEDDLPSCAELFVASFREAPWNEQWSIADASERLSGFLSHPNAIAIKASYNGFLCGLLFGEIQQWNGARSFYLKEMCVGSSLKRKGIGTRLMHHLEGMLVESGISRIYLLTQRQGAPADFYSSLGFRMNESVVVMGKPLAPIN